MGHRSAKISPQEQGCPRLCFPLVALQKHKNSSATPRAHFRPKTLPSTAGREIGKGNENKRENAVYDESRDLVSGSDRLFLSRDWFGSDCLANTSRNNLVNLKVCLQKKKQRTSLQILNCVNRFFFYHLLQKAILQQVCCMSSQYHYSHWTIPMLESTFPLVTVTMNKN